MPQTSIALVEQGADGLRSTVDPVVERLHRTRSGPLFALALGTFAVGTEGFMIAAILPTISEELSVGVGAAGLLVTVFSLVYAISSPVLTALTARVPRRILLIGALAAFVLTNLAAAFAPGYWTLVVARVLIALAAGLFVPNANALAGAIVHPSRRGRALAIVNGGITVAVAVGVPLGAVVAVHLGWRFTFVGVALLSLAALGILALKLPRDIVVNMPATLKDRLAIVGQRRPLTVLLATTVWAIGAYTVYTFISPFLSLSAGLSPASAGLVLTLLGTAAIGGVTLGGVANDRFGARKVQALALPLMALAFAGLTLSALLFAPNAGPFVLPLVALWGLSGWGFFPPQQARLIGVAGVANASVALSLNASFMYLGFSIGAFLGSLVVGLLSVAWIGLAGALCILAAMAISSVGWRQSPD